MKKSSWKKFFTRSRSKSGSRGKKGAGVAEPSVQIGAPSNLANANNEPAVQKLVAEKPLEAEIARPASNLEQDTGPSLKHESRMDSSTSQPRSSTNEDFMAEEVESQNSSINSQASEKPPAVTDLDFVQDVVQADSAAMVRHPAFSESVPSNDPVDSAQTVDQSMPAEQEAVEGAERISELVDAPGGIQEVQDESQPRVVDQISENATVDPQQEIVLESQQEILTVSKELMKVTHKVSEDGKPRTASDDEEEFAVDRSQPQQLSKLDVLGPDLQINPNYSQSDDSQKPVEPTFNITSNFVTADYKLDDSSATESQKCESILSDSGNSDTAAIVFELPPQLLNKDERPSRGAETLSGAEMLFFSGVTSSEPGHENLAPILFFGPQAGNLVEQKVVYQVANGSRSGSDTNSTSQAAGSTDSQRANDGQSPPTLEDENEDQFNFSDTVKKM